MYLKLVMINSDKSSKFSRDVDRKNTS